MLNYFVFIFVPSEGGIALLSVPHSFWGRFPIINSRVPPVRISLWEKYVLLYGFPFHWADWIYLLFRELFLAMMVNVLPLSSFIEDFVNIGLPIV